MVSVHCRKWKQRETTSNSLVYIISNLSLSKHTNTFPLPPISTHHFLQRILSGLQSSIESVCPLERLLCCWYITCSSKFPITTNFVIRVCIKSIEYFYSPFGKVFCISSWNRGSKSMALTFLNVYNLPAFSIFYANWPCCFDFCQEGLLVFFFSEISAFPLQIVLFFQARYLGILSELYARILYPDKGNFSNFKKRFIYLLL